MSKRLTAAELGDSGRMASTLLHGKVLIEATIGYPGSKMTDLLIGGHKVPVRNESFRRAAIEAEMTEPLGRRPVAYLRDLDGTGSLHVCAAGDPGAVPVYSK